ncbi:MAG TPA: hypothetical protein VGY97_05910 [Solirubrobacteraceae bacterium]|nr:hypothetical protein [Solirubrobacteraceae bacterium]
MARGSSRGRLGVLSVAMVSVSATAGLAAAGVFDSASGAACPSGFYAPAAGRDAGSAAGPDLESRAGRRHLCLSVTHPESSADLARFSQALALRSGADSPRAYRAALHQRARLAQSSASVPGTGGTWTPVGKTPLLANDPSYADTFGDGFGELSGRISDYTYDPVDKRVYAAVAQGGVYASDDLGKTWYSVGDGLPMQSVSALAWTPASGGTLIVITGDNAFSNNYAGLGVYWSTDGGDSWHHSAGVPDGGLGFRVAVDPTNPGVVYAATGLGLYRSTDAGRSFVNVNLPTGDCTGDSFKRDCFFANVVTDVAVQGTDKLGHRGGAVVAALGWRAGQYPNFDGKPQAPANGLYRSDTGVPGSFAKLPDGTGFTASSKVGRVALGAASGSDQNSSFLYALVQDSQEFTSNKEADNDVPNPPDPLGLGINPVAAATNLDGVYVSADFGKTWTQMESGQQLENPANGSSLNQIRPLGIAAGYQATYNEWIKPDPTQQDSSGVPTHVVFGLEELFQNPAPYTPQNGSSNFQVFGAYNGGGACLIVILASSCTTKQQAANFTTTHPDQHGYLLQPDGQGGVTLLAGNDGGNYVQHSSGQTDAFSQMKWGNGQQTGLHTLQPYGVAMAKDGTVYAGLQDNGEMKISPNGTQNEVFGGDGTFTQVDPNNSQVAYEELPNGHVYLTTDGGHSWNSIDPLTTDGDFVAPLVMDPLDAKHLISAGRNVAETTSGPDTTVNGSISPCDPSDPSQSCASTDWVQAYDLGTSQHPGDKTAQPSADDPNNVAYAAAVRGPNVYVGYCGSCDPVKLHQRFHSGLATNVAGSKPPQSRTPDGWHIAAARGLPQRIITAITIDPNDPKTIYVTLGASAARFFAPLGSLGEDTSQTGGGYVYKSTDAGQSFTDITGDLPRVQASWNVVHGSQLVVGTAIGAFASAGTNGGHYAPLGDNLPTVSIYSMEIAPQDPNLLVAATYGRGIYEYRFADRTPAGGGGAAAAAAAACAAASSGFSRVNATAARSGVRLDFSRSSSHLATVEIVQESRGNKILPERVVARFVGQRDSLTWNGRPNQPHRRVADGYYVARLTAAGTGGRPDVRRIALLRRHGRFSVQRPFSNQASCPLLTSFSLNRPVFGGRGRRALGIAYQITMRARVTVTVTRGRRVVGRFRSRVARAGVLHRLRLKARRRRRGLYRVRITVVASKSSHATATLYARRL